MPLRIEASVGFRAKSNVTNDEAKRPVARKLMIGAANARLPSSTAD